MFVFTTTKAVVIGLLALILVAGGITIFILLPRIIDNKIQENFKLENGTEAYDMWKEVPVPFIMEFYLFNVTNADEVINDGAKPKLKEAGPYAYSETRKKINIHVNSDGSTISYKQIRTYQFEPKFSKGTEDDVIIFPNIPLITAVKIAKTQPDLETQFRNIIVPSLTTDELKVFIRRKARELLFDGYSVPFIKTLQTATGKEFLPNGMFGLYYGKNNTDDGVYKVNTGKFDIQQFSKILEWENSEILTIWKENSTCNMINGTDGNQNPPYIPKEKLYLFMSELGRSISLDYEKETEIRGIPTYHFSLPQENLLDPTLNPDNDCFCLQGPEHCTFSGLLDISKLQKDAPVMFGLPHFLLSDPMLSHYVEGMNPKIEDHLASLDIEPTTGIPLKAARRIQVNLDMKPHHEYIPLELSRMPEMIFPLTWVNEKVIVDEASANKLKAMMITPVVIANASKITLIVLGCVLAFVAVVIFVKRARTSHNFV